MDEAVSKRGSASSEAVIGPAKKVQGSGKVEPEVVVAWIESIRDEVTVSEACTWLGIARSDLLPLEAAVETEHTEAVAEKISELCIRHKFRYGTGKPHSFGQSKK
ncbi:hypothetical protein SAMN04488600_10129 [Paenibacillus polymyxa]|uniref:hypothetical protein n=1 Tax=Paenibacillus polymyxa TaxID=1406 RepID=UPI0008D288EE|nr:hypothetical protein SAMN04488600_10129 [Paenibacillus polymyxa]